MSENRTYFLYPWDWEERKQYYNPWFPKEEYDRRVRVVNHQAIEEKLDAVFLYGDVRQYGYIRWLTQFYPQLGQSMVIQLVDGEPIIVSSAAVHGEPMHSYIPETWVKDIRIGLFMDLPVSEHPTFLSCLIDLINEKKLHNSRIGVVGLNLLTYEILYKLKCIFPRIEWCDWTNSYEKLRAVKTPAELEIYKKGAEAIDRAFEAALHAAKPGVSELEIAGILEYMMRKGGVDVVSNLFDTRVVSGYRTPLKNGNPTERRLEQGDALYMDVSAQMKGLCLDVSTSHVVGSTPNKEQLALFETAAQMSEAIIEAARPGVPAREMVNIARNVAKKNGQEKNFIEYFVSHGLGATQVEIPHFTKDSSDILKEGMVFALEPMLVDPIIGTGTIERMCTIGKNGGEVLSKLTMRPWTIDW